ncbi:response regulator transcription factor [Granulicella cerasi]|uniref:Response regulator transcription factor n=1 Tax=Granulicella cerasi TaxID=741063 RepID=A0ABW1ZBX0_9BACT|nr:response regulator transcription factor [Granulicella cerasi]
MEQKLTQDAEAGKARPRVLLVDDDRELCAGLERLLRMDGFEVTPVYDAKDGYARATDGTFDLVVLDVMLPGGDGRVLLRRIRVESEVPVIMLTARGDEKDRISGLEAGADDYLPKPFHVRELVARMRSVLKRRGPVAAAPSSMEMGDLVIDVASRRVQQQGREVALTGTEYEILLLLIRSYGRVVSRDEIAEVCLGRPVGAFDRSVDNHVSNLRKKLGAMYEGKERIQSLRGAGYAYTGGEAA